LENGCEVLAFLPERQQFTQTTEKMAKTASLEIHQLNVGQGDSTLVLLRDLQGLKNCVGQAANTMEPIDYLPYCIKNGRSLVGSVQKALLIDAGNDCYGYAVRDYCEKVGALNSKRLSQPNFLMLVTHYHDDHQDGLRCVMRGPNFSNGQDPDEVYRPGEFYRLARFDRRDRGMGVTGIIIKEIDKQVVDPTNNDRLWRTEKREIPQGGKVEAGWFSEPRQYSITLGSGVADLPVRIKVVASERSVFTGASSNVQHVEPKSQKGKKKGTIDENDRSIALVVEYGSFRHFLGGDAGGSEGKTYSDIEGVLGPRMATNWVMPAVTTGVNNAKFASAGHCCSFKLNHHGTKYANDEQFLATLQPRLVVVSAGVKLYFHGHPTKETFTRLMAPKWRKLDGTEVNNSIAPKVNNLTGAVVATEVACNGRKGKPFNPDGNKIAVLGDIVIRPIDEDIDDAQKALFTGQVRRGTVPGGIRIQVYGNREQTPLPNGSVYALRAPVIAASGGNYPTNPAEVICPLH
jgi:beta-lactamase superfamily II metal-dependent hydrolase